MSEREILLVHGELHGAWCWRDVLAELRARGLRARAIDLPGHGADPTPISEITFESYALAVLAALTPGTVLVGHGFGGYAISAAAEAAADRVAGLIYVGAYIPQAGVSLAEFRTRASSDPLEGKTHASDDGRSFSICPFAVEELLYHDCPPGVLTYAAARINKEPIAPLHAALNSLNRSSQLPRHAVLTTHDRMVPLSDQRAMARDIPAGQQHLIETSQAPFFTAPKELAELIAAITAEIHRKV